MSFTFMGHSQEGALMEAISTSVALMWRFEGLHSLKLTFFAPKNDGFPMGISFSRGLIFRCHVSFREGMMFPPMVFLNLL